MSVANAENVKPSDSSTINLSTASFSENSNTIDFTKAEPYQYILNANAPSAPANTNLIHITSTYSIIAWSSPLDDGGSPVMAYRFGLSTDNINFQYFYTANRYINFSGNLENTKYYYSVEAQNTSGYGAKISGELTTPYASDVPSPPPSVTSSDITDDTIPISWTIPLKSGSNMLGYDVAYSVDNVNWNIYNVATTNSSTENYKITNLTYGTTYYIKIAGINSNGRGLWSETYSATTTGSPKTIPYAPTALNPVNVTSYSVGLSWSAPTSDGGWPITDYVVQYKTSGASSWTTLADGVSNVTSATIKGLWGGTSYVFRVAAKNMLGAGAYTQNISKATLPKTVPPPPTGLRFSEGYKTSANVSWTAPVNNGGSTISDYIIQYKENTASSWITFNDGIKATTSAFITGLSNFKTYNYRVLAINSAGIGSASPSSYFVMSPPASPTNFVSTSSTTSSVSLSWSTATNLFKPVVRDQIIQYRKTGSNAWATFNDGGGVAPSTAVTGLTPNTSYDFRVASSNTSGWGVFSNLLTVSTKPIILAFPPANLNVLYKTKNSVLLSWEPPVQDGIKDYAVQYSTDGINWITYSDGESTSTNTLIKGLNQNTQYHFRVATLTTERSSYTNDLTTYTSASTDLSLSPTGFTATASAYTSVSLSWNQIENPNNNVIGYRIGVSTDGVIYNYSSILSQNSGYAQIYLLKSKTQYWFSIQAISSNGDGSPAILTATTL